MENADNFVDIDKRKIDNETVWWEIAETVSFQFWYKNVTHNECLPIINDLIEIAENWFWIEMSQDDILSHIIDADDVYLITCWWKICWFSSVQYVWEFVYRFWTVIHKKYQAHWLYVALNDLIFQWKKMFLRTQNQNVIKAHIKSWRTVLVWKEALLYLENNLWIEHLNKFFWHNQIDCDWIFRWVYWSYLWDSNHVKHIDDDYYKWFKPENWDALLVVII